MPTFLSSITSLCLLSVFIFLMPNFLQMFCFSYGRICSRLPPRAWVPYLNSSSAGTSAALAGNLFSSSKRSLQLDVDSFCLPLRQFCLGSLGSLSSAFVEIKRQTAMLITSNMACMQKIAISEEDIFLTLYSGHNNSDHIYFCALQISRFLSKKLFEMVIFTGLLISL